MSVFVLDEAADSYQIIGGRVDRGLLLLCDHAGNAFPDGYGTLGLPQDQLQRHIAYDIGAAGLTRRLAQRLGVPAVLTRYSRLLIDPNRGIDDPTLVMRLSDGAVVPGNRHLDEQERGRRVDLYYRPYHTAIDGLIDRAISTGALPALLSIHTFTDAWKGVPRPWHAGVLWARDGRLAQPLIAGLRADPSLVVGDNEPYTGALEGDTLWQHGLARGLASAIIEVRQDLVCDQAGEEAWADRLEAIARTLGGCADMMIDLRQPERPATVSIGVTHHEQTTP